MFDDDVKFRVNLSGSRAPNGNIFKANIQRQRLLREKNAQKCAAACCIQSFIRAYHTRSVLKNAIRSSLREDLHNISTNDLPSSQIDTIVKYFVFAVSTPTSSTDFHAIITGNPSTVSYNRTHQVEKIETTTTSTTASVTSSHLIRNLKKSTERVYSSESKPLQEAYSVKEQSTKEVVLKLLQKRCTWLEKDDIELCLSVLKVICSVELKAQPLSPLSWLKLLHIIMSHSLEIPGNEEIAHFKTPALRLLLYLIPHYPDACSNLFVALGGPQLLLTSPQFSTILLLALQDSSSLAQRSLPLSLLSSGQWPPELCSTLDRLFFSNVSLPHSHGVLSEFSRMIKEELTKGNISALPYVSELKMFSTKRMISILDPVYKPVSAVTCLHGFLSCVFLTDEASRFPLTSLIVLDSLIALSLEGTDNQPKCRLFDASLDILLNNLPILSKLLIQVPYCSVHIALTCITRVVLPMKPHQWLESIVRVGGCQNFFEASQEVAQLPAAEIEELSDTNASEDEDMNLNEITSSATFHEKKSLQSYLEEICVQPLEYVIHSPIVLRHFSSDKVTISLIVSFLSMKLNLHTSASLEDVADRFLLSLGGDELNVVISLLTSLVVLLEFQARQLTTVETELWKSNAVGLSFSSAINLVNKVAVTLVEVFYQCRKPGICSDEYFQYSKTLHMDMIAQMCRALRDLHRLRPKVLNPEEWLVHTPLLKPTSVLLDYLDTFMTTAVRGHSSSRRLLDSATLSIPFAKKTLSVLLALLSHTLKLNDRCLLLSMMVIEDRIKLFGDFRNPFTVRHGIPLNIRRNFIGTTGLEDTLKAIQNSKLSSWRHPIQVSFVDEEGVQELGIDAGGLFREFMIILSQNLFSPSFELFSELADHSLVPSTRAKSAHGTSTTTLYRLAGRIIGKALYEGITLEAVLNRAFLNSIQNRETQYLEDLINYDAEFYTHLRAIRAMGNVSDLQLTFCVTVETGEARFQEVELIPGGSSVQVTSSNVDFYIGKVTEYKLVRQFSNEAELVREGIIDIIPLAWLCGFDAWELSRIISGEEVAGLNVDDLRANVAFSGGYEYDSPVVQYLWTVLRRFNKQQQKDFLQFVTAVPRAPFLGFRLLQPRFKIHHVESTALLPSASTCLNQFNLPPYTSEEELERKLIKALENAKGFHLG